MKLQEFDPVIYPRRVWVGPLLQETLDEFSTYKGADLEFPENCFGATFHEVKNRESASLGVLVVLEEDPSIETITHEAVHAANGILSDLGVVYTSEDDETLAYFTGWIAKCIKETLEDGGDTK